MLSYPVRVFVILLCVLALSGCVKFKSKRGVEVAWQPDVIAQFERGKTSRMEVLTALGPPSQIIALEEETVLYYLFEKAEGEGMVLIVYNNIKIETRYDRAVFFFDENDLLTEYSTQIHPHDGDSDDDD
jgi:outer membrane protein assembly factor BamE (lipoprotein component of BamABCDE complex)